MAYDAMGNITSKTGVGTYTYHATKKHQVTATSGGALLAAQSYAYDANGNMNTRTGLSTTWYSYNLPNTINGPSSNSSQFFNSTRRIGIDYAQRQFVVLDEHTVGMFHGHVRTWEQLTQQMQAVLRRAGMVDGRGNIIIGD